MWMRAIVTVYIGALVLVWMMPATAADIKIVVPEAARGVEGNIETSPEGPGPGGIFLGLVRAEELQGVPDTHRFITGVRARPDKKVVQPTWLRYENLEIRLSTTAQENLLADFAANIGSDRTTVYQRTPTVFFTDGAGPADGPRDFLEMTEGGSFGAFPYDRDLGNLLIEWESSAGPSVSPIGSEYIGDVQSVSYTGAAGYALSPPHTQIFNFNTGLVWELTFSEGLSTSPEGDCNIDGIVDAADLTCVGTIVDRDAVLRALNALPGDLDGDGAVSFVDFLVLSENFGNEPATYAEGNIDLVGDIGFPDFLVLSANFGRSAEASAIPEPATGSMLLFACVWCLMLRTCRHRQIVAPNRAQPRYETQPDWQNNSEVSVAARRA